MQNKFGLKIGLATFYGLYKLVDFRVVYRMLYKCYQNKNSLCKHGFCC